MDEIGRGIDVTTNAPPVPFRSRSKCEPVNAEMRNPSAFDATYIALDYSRGTVLNIVGSGTADDNVNATNFKISSDNSNC